MGPAVASGSIDFAAGNATAAIYNLGGQGALRIIAGFAEDAPGFQLFAFAASNRAYQGGLKSFAALQGHSVAIATLGVAAAYLISLVEVNIMSIRDGSRTAAAVEFEYDSAVIGGTQILSLVPRRRSSPSLNAAMPSLSASAATR